MVTILGTAAVSSETRTATFTLTMADPCAPPTTLTAPTYTDQTYVLTTTEVVYDPPSFTIDPSYCLFSLATAVSELSPSTLGTAVVAGDGDNWKFFYDADLEPVGQTQTVTVRHRQHRQT